MRIIKRPVSLGVPDWLADLDQASIVSKPLPLEKLLGGSVFYPSSGFDGSPVANMGHWFQSFVYVDYGYSRSELHKELVEHPFSGYRLIGTREVGVGELTPRGSSRPNLTKEEIERVRDADRQRKMPFCDWLVFEREPSKSVKHGPDRFSLLYLCADGAAAYHALYINNNVSPSVIALIQPGYGFGGNWTDFHDPKGVLARTVMANSAGRPEFLLYGGWSARKNFQISPWPYYDHLEGWYSYADSGNVGLWAHSS